MAMEVEAKSRTAGCRVLVVDDEARLRDMLVRSTAELGFDAIPARSAEHALKLLEGDAGEIDVVLLDLNLPGIGGLELLERLRRDWPHLQVVILTGFGSLEAARKAIRLDVADFLTKPCSLEELDIALAKARRKRLEAASRTTLPDPTAEVGADVHAAEGAPVTLEEAERVHILAALDRHDGNRAAAAAELGISERTIYYRLGRYGRR